MSLCVPDPETLQLSFMGAEVFPLKFVVRNCWEDSLVAEDSYEHCWRFWSHQEKILGCILTFQFCLSEEWCYICRLTLYVRIQYDKRVHFFCSNGFQKLLVVELRAWYVKIGATPALALIKKYDAGVLRPVQSKPQMCIDRERPFQFAPHFWCGIHFHKDMKNHTTN